MDIEKTLVLLKPDAVKRGIVGEVLHRFERCGLKIIGVKMILATRDTVEKHYEKDDEWRKKIGNLRLEEAKNFGVDAKEIFETEDPVKIGESVNQANFDFILSGPILAVVIEGVNAVVKVRNLVGGTHPHTATPGTIRGDFGLDSPLTSMLRKRTIFNLMHASGTVEEANKEIELWFKPQELFSYRRVHDDLYSY